MINRTTITRKQKGGEKQLYWRFKRRTSDISHKTWLWKGNLLREPESFLISAQNNAIGTNHIKARIDKTQQNSWCGLCSDRDEPINHIIIECSKLAQKEYKTGRGRWYTGNCAKNWSLTTRPNGICPTQNLSWRMKHTNFSDHLISAKRTDNQQKKKRTCRIVDFAVQTYHELKAKRGISSRIC